MHCDVRTHRSGDKVALASASRQRCDSRAILSKRPSGHMARTAPNLRRAAQGRDPAARTPQESHSPAWARPPKGNREEPPAGGASKFRGEIRDPPGAQ